MKITVCYISDIDVKKSVHAIGKNEHTLVFRVGHVGLIGIVAATVLSY